MMSSARLARLVELPLLTKELNEQAARPRTYVIRFLYAALLFTAACGLFYGSFLGGGGGTAGGLGRGRAMFERLVSIQLWSIYLFLPAISCGCLTVEKERNSLGLLLITSLTPWQIILEKLLGRVVPMLGFVLLSFPLMAVAYSFGGVTADYLWSAVLLLLITCLQAGALSVACSAYYPTTVEAFVANYLIFVVLFFLFPIGWAPLLFQWAVESPFAAIAASSLFPAALTAVFLVAARAFVERRAFVPPKNALLGLFKRLDAFFQEANQITGGVVLVKDGDPLPRNEPVAWRETAKKSLGTFRYLFRVLVVLELPLLFVCQSMSLSTPGGPDLRSVSGLLYALWLLGAGMIVVHAGSVIASERTRQTLDVLLATPLAGREIVAQKMSGVRRLIRVLVVPFLTIFLFEVWWNQSGTYRWPYLALALLSLAVYLPLIAWFALWMGLRFRSQTKAVLVTIAVLGAWIAVPSVSRNIVRDLARADLPAWGERALLLNPAALVPAIEATGTIIRSSSTETESAAAAGQAPPQPSRNRTPEPEWIMFALNLLLSAALLLMLKRHCLENADRLLGRLSFPGSALSFPSSAWERDVRSSASGLSQGDVSRP